MSLHYLLDGYNLIHKIPSLAQKDIDRAREGLVSIVAINRPQGSVNNRVTIVFDGCMAVRPAAGGVEVIFAAPQSADDRIKDIVDAAAVKSILIVVTDDRELQLYVRKLGAKIMSSNDFAARIRPVGIQPEIQTRHKPSNKSLSKHIPLSKADAITKELEGIWLRRNSGPSSKSR